jgi:hypothetical protein
VSKIKTQKQAEGAFRIIAEVAIAAANDPEWDSDVELMEIQDEIDRLFSWYIRPRS